MLQHSGLSCHGQSQHPIWVPAQVPDAPVLFKHPANMFGKAADHGPSIWTPAPIWKTQMKIIQPLASTCPSLFTADIWGLSQQMEPFSLCCLSSTLCKFAIQIFLKILCRLVGIF